ncbi:MAG: hypothetical protein ABI859_17820, partial [Pseudomonadota bacterium]
MIVRVSLFAASLALSVLAASPVALAAKPYVAKAPKPADWASLAKLPDFNGVWEVRMGPPPRAANAPPPPRPPPPAPAAAGEVAATPSAVPAFLRAAAPKLTPAYEARRKALAASGAEDSLMANCVPPGMPGIMGQPYPLEFLLTPGKVTIITEAFMQVRHIYTDGRPLPENPDPTYNGTSTGHWEGDTLVVETVGLSQDIQLAPDVEHGPNTRIVERFHLTDPDTMVIERVITDPDALAEPWKNTLTVLRHREYTTAEYICQQNNRNFLTPEGKAGITLD